MQIHTGVSAAEHSRPIRAALVLATLLLAILKAAPRATKLRVNLKEFANSVFSRIFDFWKLLESVLGPGSGPRRAYQFFTKPTKPCDLLTFAFSFAFFVHPFDPEFIVSTLIAAGHI